MTDRPDTTLDRMTLSNGITQEADGRFAAFIKISGITYEDHVETVANWSIDVLHRAFLHNAPPGGTTKRITPPRQEDA